MIIEEKSVDNFFQNRICQKGGENQISDTGFSG